jgi:hypothetical protein
LWLKGKPRTDKRINYNQAVAVCRGEGLGHDW